MNRGKLIMMVVASALVTAQGSLLRADEPTTTTHPGAEAPRGAGREGAREGGRGRFAPPSEEEWQQIEAFAAENSPRRLKLLRQMRESNDPGLRPLQGFLVTRYRALQSMKEHDPDLYNKRLEGLKIEDKVFGDVEDGYGATTATPEQKATLREDVKKLVAMNLEEREERLIRLAQMIESQQKKLEEDRGRADALVDEKLDQIEREGVKGLIFDGPMRHFQDRPDDKRPEGGGRPDGPRPEGGRPPGLPPGPLPQP